MAVDRTLSTISKLKNVRELEEEHRQIRALAKVNANAMAEDLAQIEEAQ
jgi:hypothetical protein